MKTKSRLSKLIEAIERYNDSYAYYDEELDETVVDGTEEEVYNTIMQDDELHFLGEETCRKWISLWYNNWEKYEAMRLAYKQAKMI